MSFLYVSPAEIWSLYANVSGPAESSYENDWLCDGLPGRPLRATNGSPSWTVPIATKAVNFLSFGHSNVEAARAISVTGDVTQSMTQPAYKGRIPINPFKYFTDVPAVTTVTVGITSNPETVIVGQFVVGYARVLEFGLNRRGRRSPQRFNKLPDPQVGNVAVHRTDKGARRLSGTADLSAAGFALAERWFDETNDGELLSVIVPDSTVQDAWFVKFDSFEYEKESPSNYIVTVAWQEIPRKRWP